MIRLNEHPKLVGAVLGFAASMLVVLALDIHWSGERGEEPEAPVATPQPAQPAPPASPPDPHAAHRAAPADPHAEHGAAPAAPGMPAGYAAVQLAPGQATAIGLTTAPVVARDFTRDIRTVGVVAVDETRTAHVHSRVRGWIEKLHAKFVGRKVRAGEPLVAVYSQEVYAAQLELASLLRAPVPSPELAAAARQRLALWQIPPSVIAAVEQSGQPQRTFPILAPHAGTVVAQEAIEGLFIDPSIELYTISDLSRVWVLADIYEADVPYVQVGSVARLTVEGRAAPVTGKVAFLYPTIDERTRTRKVRFELDNRDGSLMPGAFVTVSLELGLGRGLAVPESAVIRTGARAIVFVVHGGAHVMPREIELGPRVGAYYRVNRGLAVGEDVATGAQFLLDSESQLRATGGNGGGHAH